jgi:hypothetical protein
MNSANNCVIFSVILCFCFLDRDIFPSTVFLGNAVCLRPSESKRERERETFSVHIFAADWTISNAAGIFFSGSMSEPRGFLAYFCGCNFKNELLLLVQGPSSPGSFRAGMCFLWKKRKCASCRWLRSRQLNVWWRSSSSPFCYLAVAGVDKIAVPL